MSSTTSTAFSSLVNSLTSSSTTSTTSSSSSSTSSSELTTESFFQLLAAQLENQDVSDPMDNSEMMTQITQIAMMQAMNNFSTAIDNFSQINTINYGTSMLGKDVEIGYYDSNGDLQEMTGTVTKVDIYSGVPTLYLDGDEDTGYSLANLMSINETDTDTTE